MQNEIDPVERARHLRLTEPSPWISRFAGLPAKGSDVLDVAAGGGRHSRVFLDQGHRVTAIDKNTTALVERFSATALSIVEFDMEAGIPLFDAASPLSGRDYDVIVVVNYLYRPLFPELLKALRPGGILLYETFALGNEVYAKPRNPDHLLKSGELLGLVSQKMQVVAYEHGLLENADIPGVKQRLCAVNDLQLSDRPDHDPSAHSIRVRPLTGS